MIYITILLYTFWLQCRSNAISALDDYNKNVGIMFHLLRRV